MLVSRSTNELCDSLITAEMRSRIGVEIGPYVVEVEAGDVRRFAEAVGGAGASQNDATGPRPGDEAAGVLATLFCPDPIIAAELCGLKRPQPFRYRIDGGSAWQFDRPVRVGDTLQLYSRIVDLYEKQGSAKTGRMLFTIIEVRCINQRNERIGIARGTAIAYEGRPAKSREDGRQ